MEIHNYADIRIIVRQGGSVRYNECYTWVKTFHLLSMKKIAWA